MAEFIRGHPELQPFVLSNVRLTGTTIGAGAYGSVEEVAVPGAICAAKKIHDFFLDAAQVTSAAVQKATTQFVAECQLMSTLRHPNVVQFLGLCFMPGSRLPAIVMERLLTSLHDLLDPETYPPPPPDAPKPFFPLNLKCSVLHNVASGITYLHERSPPIIHRDLSARNVLLNSGMVAKIADLGVARIVPRMRIAATMTKAPGAGVYMPPEALEDRPQDEEVSKAKYGASIDIFSFGVVAIFTLSQTFPSSLLPTAYRERGRLLARTELERRERYTRMIYSQLREKHPLLQMIEGCLDFPEDRPSIREMLRLLEEARAEVRDEQTDMNKLELLQALQTQRGNQQNVELLGQLRRAETELAEAQGQLRQKEEQLQSGEREEQLVRQQLILSQELRQRETELVQAKDRELQSCVREKQTVRDELTRKERELAEVQQQLRQKEEKLRSSEALVADFQQALQQRDSEIKRTKTQSRPLVTYSMLSSDKKLSVQWGHKKRAPCDMSRGSATTDGRFAYFTPSGSASVYRYEWDSEKWSQLPSCPSLDSGLVIIDRELTAVGGYAANDSTWPRMVSTDKLHTLRLWRWVEKHPPMNTAHISPAVISTPEYLIVIGGGSHTIHSFQPSEWISTVELYHLKTRSWHYLTSLPQPLTLPSATICGDQLNVIGDYTEGYTCSLQTIPHGGKPIPSSLALSWKPLPPLPVTQATAATVCGQLVIFRGGSSVNSIHQLVDGQWVEISSIGYSRLGCLVANRSPEEVVIVGGCGVVNGLIQTVNTVEKCIITK